MTGIWGAYATAIGFRDYQDAKQLERSLELARYGLAVERSAVRAGTSASALQEFASGTTVFTENLDGYGRARGGDRVWASQLRGSHAVMLSEARVLLAPEATPASQRIARGAFEARAAALDDRLLTELRDVRDRTPRSWPAGAEQRVAVGATALLLLLGLASCTVALMRLAGHRRRVEKARLEELRRLEAAALTDSLTGLGNHRAFHEELSRQIMRRARTGSVFSLVMLDLDGLKEINDSLGHRAGDERIRAVAEVLLSSRAGETAYRIGGDEFMVVLPDQRAWGALGFAQRLHRELARHRKIVRVSCGIVEPSGLESADTLVHNVDLALYEAKRTGRRAVVYSEGLAPRPTDPPEEIVTRRHHRLLATALAQAVDAKDAGTRNHCETVSTLCVLIAERLGLDSRRIERLAVAGLLHDVGKIGIADALLHKRSGLDADERDAMTNHVFMGHAIVAAAGLEEEAGWILAHHEHVDGSGYPSGLVGDEIPLEARVIRVADAFEAMTADRPYRAARTPAEALAELERGIDTQFDGECVAALRDALGLDADVPPQWLASSPEVGERRRLVETAKAASA